MSGNARSDTCWSLSLRYCRIYPLPFFLLLFAPPLLPLRYILSFIDAAVGAAGFHLRGLCGICLLCRVRCSCCYGGGGLFRPPAAIFRSLYFLPLNLRAYVIVVFGVRARWDVSSSISSNDVPVPANKNTSLLLWFFVVRLLTTVSLLPVTSLSFVSDWCSTSSLLTSPLHPHPHTPPSCCCRCYISSLGLIFPICYFSATDTYASLSLAVAPMCLSKDEYKDGSNTNVEDAS